jgi:hypothetical protein
MRRPAAIAFSFLLAATPVVANADLAAVADGWRIERVERVIDASE